MLFKSLFALAGLIGSALAQCESCTSCSTDTCQVNSPGGMLVLTLQWQSLGPNNAFTIHGLWPDYCDTGYPGNCDASREYTDITGKLQQGGETQLLSDMQTYWPSNTGDDETFWEHEFAKHGTCVSTLSPDCYSSYTQYQDLYDYLQTVIDLRAKYDVYSALTSAGIYPSSSATYSLSALKAATQSAFGYPAAFRCTNGAISEVWVPFHTLGRSTDASAFVQIAPQTSMTSCSSTGIKWLPK